MCLNGTCSDICVFVSHQENDFMSIALTSKFNYICHQWWILWGILIQIPIPDNKNIMLTPAAVLHDFMFFLC